MRRVKLFRFALVGCVGFIVDASVFGFFYQQIGLDLMIARVIAFIVAATTTWFGNRHFTFTHCKNSSKLLQWQKFLAVACFSALPNLLVFKLMASVLSGYYIGVYIALVIGVLAGMMSNYLLSERWVFRAEK